VKTKSPEILRYTAFSDDPRGGNPAGVVLDASALDEAAMQRIAAEVDYAETAFVTGEAGGVVIETSYDGTGLRGAFTSVDTEVAQFPEFVLEALLDLIGVDRTELDERFPPTLAYAGNWHPVVVIANRDVFDGFTFDPGAARAFIDAQGWPATITVLHPFATDRFEARNIFPVGRITEDPATGAAAAAVGAYLRGLGLVGPPGRILIEQGRHVGRPGELTVDIPERGGIVVSGRAVEIR